MHPLERVTLATIRKRQLLADGDRLVVGVSGGPDSMALLHVLAKLVPQLSLAITVAHINHRLRPAEAAREESLVCEQAARLGFPSQVASIDVQEQARQQGLSVEHAGRLARYGFFDKVAEEFGAVKIAVGHTADDQAEEILLRLLRGAGRKGLAGMDFNRGGRIIRPFLDTPKATLLRYLAERQIPYLTDSSNESPVYLRNRIRLELLPFLENNFNPNVRATLRRTADILREEEEYLDRLAQAAFDDCVKPEASAVDGLPVFSLLKTECLALPRAISRRVVEALFLKLAVSPGFAQVEAILRFCQIKGGSGVLHMKSGLRVRNQPDRLVLSFPRGREAGRG